MLPDFGKAAQGLSRNPLGIIALFIVLVYGIAALILGTAGRQMQPDERQPLIWFLVVFPILVLALFGWLVSNHHGKLYAPGDFKSDESFLESLSPERQRERLAEEVSDLVTPPSAPEGTVAAPGAGALPGPDRAHIKEEVVLEKDLVLRALELRYGRPVRRNTTIRKDRHRVDLDGVLETNDGLLAIEVRSIREAIVRTNSAYIAEYAISIAHRLREVQENVSISFLLALVGSDLTRETRDRILAVVRESFERSKVPADVEVFDLNELRIQFGLPLELRGAREG